MKREYDPMDNYLGFLKRIALTNEMLDYWLSVPEFKNRCIELKHQGFSFDNESVLKIMTEIYREKRKLYESGNEYGFFRFNMARSSLMFLSKRTYGENHAWEKL